jgi:hypothetical protein
VQGSPFFTLAIFLTGLHSLSKDYKSKNIIQEKAEKGAINSLFVAHKIRTAIKNAMKFVWIQHAI